MKLRLCDIFIDNILGASKQGNDLENNRRYKSFVFFYLFEQDVHGLAPDPVHLIFEIEFDDTASTKVINQSFKAKICYLQILSEI